MNFNGDVDSIVATQAGIEQSYFSNTLIFTQGGDVSLSFIGSNGCTEEVNFEVPVDTLIPSINLEIQNIDCNNPNGIAELLSPDSKVNYEWTNDPSSTTSFESSEQGTFTIVATDIASGCSITQDFEIEADTISPALSLVWDSLSCLNPTTTILSNPEGDYDYQWNLPNGNNAGEQDLLISETGMYMVTVTSDNGCTTAYDFEVLGDLEVPDFDIQPASTISCIETTSEINLTFNSPIISATGEIQGENIDLTTGFYETDLGGDYNITVTGKNGCTEEVTLGVPVDTLAPISQVEANFINCINTAGSANVINPDSQVDYTWLDTAGNPTSGETITVNEATTLTLFSEGPNGCISENIIVIEVDTASPPVSAETTDINCIDDFSTVSVVDPIQGIEYEWTANNNFQNSELSFSTTELGIYTLTALNPENGCFSSTEVEVNGLSNLPISFDFMILEPDCGFEEFTIMGFSFEGGSEPYEYNIGNGWQNSSQEATILPGNQDISIIDANGCTLDTSIFLSVPPSLEAEIEESILVNWGESGTTELILNKPLEDIESIQWVPATGLSCDDCVSPIIDVFEDQSYTIFVVDKDGCEDVVTFRVQVQKKISVYLPNVFTPNGIDNRRFFPFGTAQHITNISDFQIFDRWGNKVFLNEEFLPNQESEGWDGTFNNQEATEGVYAYLVTINYIDGSSEVLAGDVTLIR